jgi:uncharacterized protein YoxC
MMKLKNVRWLLILCCIGLLCGANTCETIGPGVVEETNRIAKEMKQQVGDLKQAQTEMKEAQAKLNEAQGKNSQFVSDRVSGARHANNINQATNAYTGVVENELAPATQLLPPPSPQVAADIEAKLKLALSSAAADRAALQERYAALQKESEQLKAQAAGLGVDLAKKTQTLDEQTKKVEGAATEIASLAEKAKLEAARAADQQKRADAERAAKVRMRIAAIFMIVGGVVIAGGVAAGFFGVANVMAPCICLGVVLGVIGWVITFIEGLMQYLWFKILVVAIIVAVLAVVAWLIYKAFQKRSLSKLDEKISNTTIGALQEAKNTDEDTGSKNFDGVKNFLRDWHTTPDGYPDDDIQREIDRRLVAMNLRSPRPLVVQTAPGTSPPPSAGNGAAGTRVATPPPATPMGIAPVLSGAVPADAELAKGQN